MKRFIYAFCTSVVLLIFLASPHAFAATDVSNTDDLQAAINSVGDGETINFTDSYIVLSNQITIDKSITFTSSVGGTTITAAKGYRHFQISPASGGTFTFNGVSLSGPVAKDSANVNGGLDIRGGGTSEINFINSTISGNECNNTSSGGGAIYIQNANVVINGANITGNKAPLGGGIYLYKLGSGTTPSLAITNSTISDNNSTSGSFGGGGIQMNSGTLTINSCNFINNKADSNGSGGGIRAQAGTYIYVTGSTEFSGNTALRGGGIFSWGNINISGSNNNFTNNTASSSAGGGGIYTDKFENLFVNSAVFSGNTSTPTYGQALPASVLSVYNQQIKNVSDNSLNTTYLYNNADINYGGCWTVTFHDNYNGKSMVVYAVKNGTVDSPAFSRTGYEFDGWYTDSTVRTGGHWDSETSVTADISLYAHWVVDHSDDNNGNNSNGSSGNNSGSGSNNNNSIIIDSSNNNVTVESNNGGNGYINPDNPNAGSDVTVTVKPDINYEMESLIILDEKGNKISYKDNGNNEYIYKQPVGKVTISVIFRPISGIKNYLNATDHISYIIGDDKGNFNPTASMTRAEASMLLYNLLINKNVIITKEFTDVPEGKWHTQAVLVAASLNAVKGFDDGTFRPEQPITRAEFVAMIACFANKTTLTSKKIYDDVEVDHWAYKYIAAATQFGWVSGYVGGEFEPDKDISRAEATAFINRTLGRKADITHINKKLSEIKLFPDVPQTYWAFYEIVEASNAHNQTITNNTEIWTSIK